MRVIQDFSQSKVASEKLADDLRYADHLSQVSIDELRALNDLENLDFDPAADATEEDHLSHPKSFEEVTGIDPSPFYKEESPFTLVMSKGATYIDVNLSKNRLVFYKNGSAVLSTYISHGRAGKRTPTGTYRVWFKDDDAFSWKYSKKDKKGNIIKKAWMLYSLFFIGNAYAIHQGDTSSQSRGCIRVPTGTAAKLFRLVPLGTNVKIHY